MFQAGATSELAHGLQHQSSVAISVWHASEDDRRSQGVGVGGPPGRLPPAAP